MKKNFYVMAVLILTVSLSSCSGLFVGRKGDFFHTSVGDTVVAKQLKSIGVYVLSNRKTRGGVFNFVESVSDFPDEVEHGTTFRPDTSNSGPSLELANAIAKELWERGYSAKVASGAAQSGSVTVEDCIKDAKNEGFDGVFIAYYTGYNQWSKIEGVTYSWGATTTHIGVFDGYMYITNSGLFDVQSRSQLWKNSYYGIVENAHVINFFNEPFTIAVPKALYDCSGETYFAAAPHAAKIIFDPPLWKESFKEFPSKGERKKRL